MNAIIALCHFCEAHGPSILFCTQAFHQAQDAQLLMDSAPHDRRQATVTDGYGPRLEESSERDLRSSSLLQPPPKSSDQCDACRSFTSDQNPTGFITYDPKAQITYISSQYPEQKELYSILRQACVRSLNSERCPGREGPIMFGEDNASHTLSHTFKIFDSQARGFTRLYSLMVVMTDRVFLVNSWPFLIQNMQEIIETIQEKASKIYTQEVEENNMTKSRLLQSHVPDQMRRIRTGRSLTLLTGDKNLHVYLHEHFVYVLKAGGHRLTETIVEGPPQAMASHESVCQLSDDELYSKLSQAIIAPEFRVLQFDKQPVFKSMRHLLKILGKEDFFKLAYHIMRGDQLIVRGSDPSTVMSVMDILKDLLPETICRITGFSQEYKDSYMTEFLGLSVGVNLSKHIVDSELHVLLDILPPLQNTEAIKYHYDLLQRHYSRSAGERLAPLIEGIDPLESYMLMVYSAQNRISESKYPLIVRRVMNIISSEIISDSLISQAVLNLKEEWMHKVKVLYKLSQMYPKDSYEKDEKFVRLCKDVLFVPIEDIPILMHWRAALRKDFKMHMMQNKEHEPEITTVR